MLSHRNNALGSRKSPRNISTTFGIETIRALRAIMTYLEQTGEQSNEHYGP